MTDEELDAILERAAGVYPEDSGWNGTEAEDALPIVTEDVPALVAEVRRLRHRIEHAAPWPHEGMALDDERLRALRLRWSFGPEQYQGDADALIATLLRERQALASVTAERDAALTEAERLRTESAHLRADRDSHCVWWGRAREAATGDAEGGGLMGEFVASLASLRAEAEHLRRENAYLAPRQRAGQRIFNAAYAIDPAFADSVRASDVDPFHYDERCEAFLRAWVQSMDERRQPREPDPPCGACGLGMACVEPGCCTEPGADGVLCHKECPVASAAPSDGVLSPAVRREPGADNGRTLSGSVAAPILCPTCRSAPAEPARGAEAPFGSLACRACGAVLVPEAKP